MALVTFEDTAVFVEQPDSQLGHLRAHDAPLVITSD
jgi:hypothetical protein